jgi:hypothetical protein
MIVPTLSVVKYSRGYWPNRRKKKWWMGFGFFCFRFFFHLHGVGSFIEVDK